MKHSATSMPGESCVSNLASTPILAVPWSAYQRPKPRSGIRSDQFLDIWIALKLLGKSIPGKHLDADDHEFVGVDHHQETCGLSQLQHSSSTWPNTFGVDRRGDISEKLRNVIRPGPGAYNKNTLHFCTPWIYNHIYIIYIEYTLPPYTPQPSPARPGICCFNWVALMRLCAQMLV